MMRACAAIQPISSTAQSLRCMQGLPSSGWVTFGGSSPDSPPRSPIHDAWATPSAASSAAHELPMAETSAAMHQLQLEPSAAADMQMDMPEIEECSVTTEDAHGKQGAPRILPVPARSLCYTYPHVRRVRLHAFSGLNIIGLSAC